jgi:hypothetical protein
MDNEISRLVEHFDHDDPSYSREGTPRRAIYCELRSTCPVAHTDN